jgi:hypothetical protein
MHERHLGFALTMALALAVCCAPLASAQSGRLRQSGQREARASGLSGREVKTSREGVPERLDERPPEEESSRAGGRTYDVRGLNEGRRAPVAHALDPEHITFAIIMGMIVLILVSGRV